MSAFVSAALVTVASLAFTGCVQVQPPSDTGDSLVPTAPDAPTGGGSSPQTLTYDQNLKPVFDADCVVCHGPFRADAGYRMTSYAQVMRAVRAGNASSPLVVVTRRSGSMYRYFSGDRATRSQMVFDWVVNSGAAQSP